MNTPSNTNGLKNNVRLQEKITLRGRSDAMLVKAIRIHPEFKGRSTQELLSVVHRAKVGHHEVLLRMSKQLVPSYSAILRSEGIKVRVMNSSN